MSFLGWTSTLSRYFFSRHRATALRASAYATRIITSLGKMLSSYAHAGAAAVAAARPPGRKPAQAGGLTVPGTRSCASRGARFVTRSGINKNDPSTWYGGAQDTPEMDADDGPLQVLSGDEFAKLLSGVSAHPASARPTLLR